MAEGSRVYNRDDNRGDKAAHPTKLAIGLHNDIRWKTEEGHTRLKFQEAFFYVDNEMVSSPNPGWLQTAFDTLTGLFERVV